MLGFSYPPDKHDPMASARSLRWQDVRDYDLDELARLLKEPATAREGLIHLAADAVVAA
jgi:hypothetical protein